MDYKINDFKLPKRAENSNKGTFGKILNVSGSKYMSGAAYLSSISALRVGAGYVELASDENTLRAVASLAPEIVLAPIDQISETLKTANVLTIGCGLSTSDNAVWIFTETLKNTPDIPVVIDADGLNILAKNKSIKLPEKLILTPHPKEASRLLGVELDYVLNNMENSAKEISKNYNCITVLKSHKTIIVDNNGNIYRNTTGNSALAKAGSGDVLAGMISGILAQGSKLFDACVLGVYLHGLAGDIAKNDLTEYGVLASDLVRYIHYAVKKFTV